MSRPRRSCRDTEDVPATLPIDWFDDDSLAGDDESESESDDHDADSDFEARDDRDDDDRDDDDRDDDDRDDDDASDDDDRDDDDASDDDASDDASDDDASNEAQRFRAELMRELCTENKAYGAFTMEETRWALRMISRLDFGVVFTTVSAREFVGRVMTPAHDVDAAVRCVWRIAHLMRTEGVYERLSVPFGERGGVPLAFRRVDTVQFLFACLLVMNENKIDLFDIGTPEERRDRRQKIDQLPPDVVRENVEPHLRERLDEACVRAIAEEMWGEVRAPLRALEEAGEGDRVVRQHVGRAIAALVSAKRAGFDFDAVGWIPRRPERADPRGPSIPTHGASRSARPTNDKRRVCLKVRGADGSIERLVYAHVPKDGFLIETTIDYAKTTYEDVALLGGLLGPDLTLVWDVRYPGNPILAKGELRAKYGARLVLHAVPRAYFDGRGVAPLEFASVRANAAKDVDTAIRAAVGDDPRSGTRDTIELEYGGLGWKTSGAIRGNPNADPAKARVIASRENKIRRLVDVAKRRFLKRLDVVAKRATPPTERVAKNFAANPSFYVKKVF